jgi:heme oxygenase
LRDETRTAHEQIERDLALDSCLSSIEAYRSLLERFYGFHAAWEAAAAPVIADPGFFDTRRKVPVLEKDLLALGHSPATIARLPLCPGASAARTLEEALGAFYVLEGSTLGGQQIAREVARRLGLDGSSGCAYFGCYGAAIGAMWSAFRTRLETAASPSGGDAIVASAARTFEALRAWLCRVPITP